MFLPDVQGEECGAAVEDGGQWRHQSCHHHSYHKSPQTCDTHTHTQMHGGEKKFIKPFDTIINENFQILTTRHEFNDQFGKGDVGASNLSSTHSHTLFWINTTYSVWNMKNSQRSFTHRRVDDETKYSAHVELMFLWSNFYLKGRHCTFKALLLWLLILAGKCSLCEASSMQDKSLVCVKSY